MLHTHHISIRKRNDVCNVIVLCIVSSACKWCRQFRASKKEQSQNFTWKGENPPGKKQRCVCSRDLVTKVLIHHPWPWSCGAMTRRTSRLGGHAPQTRLDLPELISYVAAVATLWNMYEHTKQNHTRPLPCIAKHSVPQMRRLWNMVLRQRCVELFITCTWKTWCVAITTISQTYEQQHTRPWPCFCCKSAFNIPMLRSCIAAVAT